MRKIYWQVGPLEVQIGMVSRTVAVFWRPRWHRLLAFRWWYAA